MSAELHRKRLEKQRAEKAVEEDRARSVRAVERMEGDEEGVEGGAEAKEKEGESHRKLSNRFVEEELPRRQWEVENRKRSEKGIERKFRIEYMGWRMREGGARKEGAEAHEKYR